jgi:ABC-type lipoprotein export system ATPase subunit
VRKLLPPPAFALEQVSHRYPAARGELAPMPILERASFVAPSAGLLGLTGPSGVGKSTLLRLLAGMDEPCAGTVRVLGEPVPFRARRALRAHREAVALALQAAPLVAHLDARQNAALPLLLRGLPAQATLRAAEALLASLGLEHEARQRPHELSGGQKQRVSLVRALLCGERLVLADEPTAGLDAASSELVIAELRAALHAQRRSVIVASHDARLLAACDVVFELADGALQERAASHAALADASAVEHVSTCVPAPPRLARASGSF